MGSWIIGIFSILTIFLSTSSSNEFEGRIAIWEETPYDTTQLDIYVKGNHVRVDIRAKEGGVDRTTIVDLNKSEVILISPNQKAYLYPQKIGPFNAKVAINKSENKKIINGQECIQWRVKESTTRDESAFWVTPMKMSFFEKLLAIYDPTESNLRAFLMIPARQGYFPMLYEERTFLRFEKKKIRVKEINHITLSNDIFSIPKHYTLIRH